MRLLSQVGEDAEITFSRAKGKKVTVTPKCIQDFFLCWVLYSRTPPISASLPGLLPRSLIGASHSCRVAGAPVAIISQKSFREKVRPDTVTLRGKCLLLAR